MGSTSSIYENILVVMLMISGYHNKKLRLK
jgi:hypothetical protein